MDAEIRITVKENGDVELEGSRCSVVDTVKAINALIQVVEGLRSSQVVDFGMKKEVK